MADNMETSRIQQELSQLEAVKLQKTAELEAVRRDAALNEMSIEEELDEITTNEIVSSTNPDSKCLPIRRWR
jgi:hypothetical protein